MSGRGKSKKSMALINAMFDILKEIQPASVRAVAYQLFIRKLIPSMGVNETKRVSGQLVFAREEAIVPWEWIVDDTRRPEKVSTWANPESYMWAVLRSYRRNFWNDQPERVEIWSEKGTIAGTLAPILEEYALPFRVNHGFASATVIQQVAEETTVLDAPLKVLYVGDFDPSGMYMSEVDLPERLDRYGANVEIIRVALTVEDLDGLPSFDAEEKTQDKRKEWFVENYGQTCYEVDALSPNLLRSRVDDAIMELLDVDAWNRAVEVQAAERESMTSFLKTWKGISERVPK